MVKTGQVQEDLPQFINMRKLKYYIVHCTATPEGREVTSEELNLWWDQRWGKNRKNGYSKLIHLDGGQEILTNYDNNAWKESDEITWGAKGYNSFAHHSCYVGGTEKGNLNKAKDTRTYDQKRSLMADMLNFHYLHPDIIFGGHNQISNKACPSFDVRKFCQEIGIPEKNILQNPPTFNLGQGLDMFDFHHDPEWLLKM